LRDALVLARATETTANPEIRMILKSLLASLAATLSLASLAPAETVTLLNVS